MGARTVAGVDGRTWSVRRSVAWSLPATGDDFEHDVDGGRGAAVLILSSLFLFWVIIIVWSPSGVHVPWYIWIVATLIVMFFPIRWWLRRPWTVVAETEGDYDAARRALDRPDPGRQPRAGGDAHRRAPPAHPGHPGPRRQSACSRSESTTRSHWDPRA